MKFQHPSKINPGYVTDYSIKPKHVSNIDLTTRDFFKLDWKLDSKTNYFFKQFYKIHISYTIIISDISFKSYKSLISKCLDKYSLFESEYKKIRVAIRKSKVNTF